jgi:hypothetical protein
MTVMLVFAALVSLLLLEFAVALRLTLLLLLCPCSPRSTHVAAFSRLHPSGLGGDQLSSWSIP